MFCNLTIHFIVNQVYETNEELALPQVYTTVSKSSFPFFDQELDNSKASGDFLTYIQKKGISLELANTVIKEKLSVFDFSNKSLKKGTKKTTTCLVGNVCRLLCAAVTYDDVIGLLPSTKHG